MTNKNTPLIPWNQEGPHDFPVYLDTKKHGYIQRLLRYLQLNPSGDYNHDHDTIEEEDG